MKKGRLSLETRKSLTGFAFVSVWVVGFIFFFLVPLIQSISFSFSKVRITSNGFALKYSGIANYAYIFKEHPTFSDKLISAFTSFCYSLPIIVALSLILAVILNQKFRGRMLARMVFFIPVIIVSGVVMEQFYMDAGSVATATDSSSVYFSGGIDYTVILSGMGLPSAIIDVVSRYINQITMLIWNCSVPTVLFLSGLQSIPYQLYEVSRVEGANKWQEFWFITFPMLGNVLVVTIAFVAIDIFTNAQNEVINLAYHWIMQRQEYARSSAMLWSYFGLVGIVLIVLYKLLYSALLKKWK